MTEVIQITMVRDSVDNLPVCPIPEPYRLRKFRKGEAETWAKLEESVGDLAPLSRALDHFNQEFGDRQDEMEDRCFFLEDGDGNVVGTTTAWHGELTPGEDWGQIHWVSIHPSHQGRGLSKPLVAAAMKRLAQSHRKMYLGTQAHKLIAIKIYLDFGFRPYIQNDADLQVWRNIGAELNHPALKDI